MNVALDTHPLYTTRAGVARYVRGLLGGLRAACPEIDVTEIAWPFENHDYVQPRRAWRTFYRELVWARTTGPKALRASGGEVWHSTALPLFAPTDRPHVVTLHDLAVLRHPERYRTWQRRRAHARLRWVAAADRVVCVSRFTADEAMALLHLPAARLDVVPNGVTPLAAAGAVPAAVPDEFFLFVGSLEPGKNLALLRHVWAGAAREGKTLPSLVIAGARWAGVGTEGPPPPDWCFLGEVNDAVLGALYRRARGLVFPSRYEGFGLPVVEALAAGCPLVCAPLASLPEVAGDAALWAELDPATWLGALRRLLADAALERMLRAAGPVQAARFTWERCARETAAVWRAAVTKKSGGA